MPNMMQEISKTKYRPEGWSNPYNGNPLFESKQSVFEAGANAMLWMLLNEARKYGLTEHHYMRHDDYLCDVFAHKLDI